MADKKTEAGAEELAADKADKKPVSKKPVSKKPAKEYGGKEGLEPTRYGDWEKGGLISDF